MNFLQQHWRDAVEILILWLCLYQGYRVFRSTRGASILVGLAFVLIALTLISYLLNLNVIWWIITRMAALLTVTLVIIFQPELRHALARLGSANWFSFNRSQKQAFFEVFSDTVICLSQKRTGALIAFERGISLGEHAETGVRLDAIFSKELVQTIFNPKTALHDGGMIISNETIHSAGCVFPVTQRHLSDRSLGLRHRAAIGVSEETDAVAIVVSEETGNISICADGKMERAISPQDFLDRLLLLFLPNDQETEEPRDEQPDREDRIPPASDRDLVSD